MTTTTMHPVPVGDTTLARSEAGDGETVVLIHGGFVADTMAPLAESPALTPFRRVLYHRRGYGESAGTTTPPPQTLEEQAADVVALLDHDGIGSAHLVGHSYGAVVALVTAARHPDRVRSLALLEPPTTFGRPEGQRWVADVMPVAGTFAEGDVTGAVTGFFDAIYRPGWRDRMEEARPGTLQDAIRDARTAFESDMGALDWSQGLDADGVAAVRCPVLSVLGTDTLPVFTDGRELLHDWFPWCRDADVAGGDHLLPVDRTEETAEAIAAFLRDAATAP
jgi:pimeloyl-ACP methyl ester carboxylesterase